MYSYTPAEVAELVDAPASGAGELMLVEVQVLFSAPLSFCAHGRCETARVRTAPATLQAIAVNDRLFTEP